MNITTVFAIIAGALCVAGFVALAWMMAAVHLWPKYLESLNYSGKSRFLAYTLLAVIVIAAGVFGYYGAHGLLWMIPDAWGSADEYGDWTSTRGYVAGCAAVVFAFWFYPTMQRLASLSVDRDRLAFVVKEQEALIGASKSTLLSKLQQYEALAKGEFSSPGDRLLGANPGKSHSVHTFLQLAQMTRAALGVVDQVQDQTTPH